MLFTTYAAMDMGRDNGGVVDEAYAEKAPYAFTGTVKRVVFDLNPAEAAARHSDARDLHHHEQVQGVAAGAAA